MTKVEDTTLPKKKPVKVIVKEIVLPKKQLDTFLTAVNKYKQKNKGN